MAAAVRLVGWNLGGGLVAVVAVGGAIALLASGWLARRWSTSRLAAAAAVLSVVAILAVTIGVRAKGGASLRVEFGWLADRSLWRQALRTEDEWRLNAALFVPAGLFLTRASRRPLRMLLGLAVLSLVIELVQGVTGLGAPDPADLVANTIGAAAGIALGVVIGMIWPARPGRRLGPRSIAFGVVAALATVGVVWLGLQAAANTRQAQLADQLRRSFDGTTAPDIAGRAGTDEGYTELLRAVPVRPDYLGEVGTTGEWEGRWSMELLGQHRCVFVRWYPDVMTMQDGEGAVCTTFHDRPPVE